MALDGDCRITDGSIEVPLSEEAAKSGMRGRRFRFNEMPLAEQDWHSWQFTHWVHEDTESWNAQLEPDLFEERGRARAHYAARVRRRIRMIEGMIDHLPPPDIRIGHVVCAELDLRLAVAVGGLRNWRQARRHALRALRMGRSDPAAWRRIAHVTMLRQRGIRLDGVINEGPELSCPNSCRESGGTCGLERTFAILSRGLAYLRCGLECAHTDIGMSMMVGYYEERICTLIEDMKAAAEAGYCPPDP